MRGTFASFGFLVLLNVSCQSTPGASGAATPPQSTESEPVVRVTPPPATVSSASATSAPLPARAPARVPRELWRVGMTLSAVGSISDKPWQHVMGVVPGKRAEYFDLSSEMQTVIYVAGPVECSGQIEVEGTVMEVTAPSKRPGKLPSKSDGEHRELHLDVSSFRCLP
ncbi:MAG TPA: hypothetical protein PKA88_17280 [Polyangiaceae bacterium]|nr:hypothetical protein [Polyangiaceae bacterium]